MQSNITQLLALINTQHENIYLFGIASFLIYIPGVIKAQILQSDNMVLSAQSV